MAAGLSMDEDKIMAFRKAINAKANLTEEDIREKVVIDVAMPISYITKELVEEFALLEPFGKGNPKPIFAQKDLDVVDYRLFGKGKKVAKVRLRDQTGRIVEGVLFRDVERFENLMKGGRMISIAYYPTINSWRDMDKLEVVISNFF